MKKLFKIPVRFLWVFASIVILQACYPGGSIPLSDLDSNTTLYNTDDLATAPTSAALFWEVLQITDEDGNDDLDYNGEVDDEILNTTLMELVKLFPNDTVYIISETAVLSPPLTITGEKVKIVVPTVDPIPDVESLYAPSIILRNKTVIYTYPGYGWGGGWWGGWWGCYYCGYPSVGYSSYEVGTVLLDMYDLRNIPAGGPVPGDFDQSWIGIMRGLVASNPSTNSSRVISGIQQVFKQSPYLSPNN